MERTALFPGSFDPFTVGHKAVIDRGLSLFDKVVVGVGVNPDKQGLLDSEGRVELIRRVFENDRRVEVAMYEGLTGEFCRSRGIVHILRGMRNSADFDYERTLEMANNQLFPEIITVAVFTPVEYIPVSSRLVREIVAMGGDPKPFMPAGIDIKNYL